MRNHNNRLLDLIFSSNNANIQCQVNKCDHSLVPEDTHHPSLEICIRHHVKNNKLDNSFFRNKEKPVQYNFRKADYIELLNYDWSHLWTLTSANEAMMNFTKFLTILYQNDSSVVLHILFGLVLH